MSSRARSGNEVSFCLCLQFSSFHYPKDSLILQLYAMAIGKHVCAVAEQSATRKNSWLRFAEKGLMVQCFGCSPPDLCGFDPEYDCMFDPCRAYHIKRQSSLGCVHSLKMKRYTRSGDTSRLLRRRCTKSKLSHMFKRCSWIVWLR